MESQLPFRLRVGNVLWQHVIQPYLFRKDPEDAHVSTVHTLQQIQSYGLTPLVRYLFQSYHTHTKSLRNITLIGGVAWKNKVGLAAGFDKNAEVLHALDAFGFGAIEVGTVTPRPQEGNPKPRVFRHPDARAIVNRYGFNSKGADAVAENIAKTHRNYTITCPIGVSIGKNKDTLEKNAVDDYVWAFRTLAPVLRQNVDYVKINISSPNTPGLRSLFDRLDEFLEEFRGRISRIATWDVPLYLKVPPDIITQKEYTRIVEIAAKHRISAIEATNTTANPEYKKACGIPIAQEGGLSGEPLRLATDAALAMLHPAAKQYGIDLIGVGGISCGEHALEKITRGKAKAIQIYTGLVFRGPILLHEILEKLHSEGLAKKEIRMPFKPDENVRILPKRIQ